MNSRQVTILWIIAVALAVAVGLVKMRQQSAGDTATHRSPGQTLLETFPADQVARITLTDAKDTLTLIKKNETWVISERDDYPAKVQNVLSLLRTLADLKVVQSMEAGPSFAPRFGMDEQSKDPDNRGITAAFADADGNEITRVSVGRTLDGGGRFVRNHADESGFYAVNDMLYTVDRDPARWLDETFIRPEKISSIRVADAADGGRVHWHVTRDREEGDFQLAGGAPGETLDATVADSFKRLMSFARFQDVVPASEVTASTAAEPAPRVATIETFEGFKYTLTITPAAPSAADPAEPDAMPPAQDDQLLAIEVEATLPAERKKGETESDEDAANLDKAFDERLATLKDKLEKEKALAGRTFRVTKSVVEPLLKSRDDVTAEPPATEQAGSENTSNPQNVVTTPPIEIPVRPDPSAE